LVIVLPNCRKLDPAINGILIKNTTFSVAFFLACISSNTCWGISLPYCAVANSINLDSNSFPADLPSSPDSPIAEAVAVVNTSPALANLPVFPKVLAIAL